MHRLQLPLVPGILAGPASVRRDIFQRVCLIRSRLKWFPIKASDPAGMCKWSSCSAALASDCCTEWH